MEKAQQKQKSYCDKGTQIRELTVGDKVLILLPSSDKKLLATWHGPYTVVGQVTPVTYRVTVPRTGPKGQVYHINLLKKLEKPPPQSKDVVMSVNNITCSKPMEIFIQPSGLTAVERPVTGETLSSGHSTIC